MPIPNTDSLVSNNREEHESHQNAHRCGQPGQQHGLRIPSLSSEHTLSTCCRLVSSFLTEMVQQIHSFRASGVMSSQAASAFTSDASAFRRSAGRSCTTPPEIRMVVMELSRRLKVQASDTRVQLGFWDYRGLLGSNQAITAESGSEIRSHALCAFWTPGRPYHLAETQSHRVDNRFRIANNAPTQRTHPCLE
jgi:hypothetical protein